MAAVSVKQKILDALGMFWGKLKTTYVTSTASNAGDNLALAASAGYNLQQQINTLNSKTTADLTMNSSVCNSQSTIRLKKSGNIVVLHGIANLKSAGVGLRLATAPEGYRPYPSQQWVATFMYGQSASAEVIVYTSGDISINSMSQGVDIKMCGCWVV